MSTEGRGGNWNRAGRRSGGHRHAILIVPEDTPLKCDACDKEATHRIPIQCGEKLPEGMNGCLCDEHTQSLLDSLNPKRGG